MPSLPVPVTVSEPVSPMVRSAIEKMAALGASGSVVVVEAAAPLTVLVVPSARTMTASSAALT